MVSQQFQNKNAKSASTQTSAAVMVVLLCMTIFKGTWSGNDNNKNNSKAKDNIISITDEFDYSTPSCKLILTDLYLKMTISVKSRLLKCFSEDDLDFCMIGGEAVPTIDFESDSENSESEFDNELDFLSDKMENINLTPKNEEQQSWSYTPGALVKVVAKMFDNEQENSTQVRIETATN